MNKFQLKKLEEVFNSEGHILSQNITPPPDSPHLQNDTLSIPQINDKNTQNNDLIDSIQCPHCLANVPKSSYDLHTLHCFKNKKYFIIIFRMHRVLCKICNQPVLEVDIDIKHVHCQDCDLIFTKDTIIDHINKEHAPVVFINIIQKCVCGKSVARADYDNHLKNECPKRKGTCPYCSLPIEMDSFNEHIVFFLILGFMWQSYR